MEARVLSGQSLVQDIGFVNSLLHESIYFSAFYENSREFLQDKITEDKLILKPLFAGDKEDIRHRNT